MNTSIKWEICNNVYIIVDVFSTPRIKFEHYHNLSRGNSCMNGKNAIVMQTVMYATSLIHYGLDVVFVYLHISIIMQTYLRAWS